MIFDFLLLFFVKDLFFLKAGFVLFFLLARSVLLSDDKLNDLQRKFFLHFSTDIACFFSNKHDQKKVKEKNGNLLFLLYRLRISGFTLRSCGLLDSILKIDLQKSVFSMFSYLLLQCYLHQQFGVSVILKFKKFFYFSIRYRSDKQWFTKENQQSPTYVVN